jgi:MerR family transcriptional regulator, light-induced transcriptional regulator
MSARQMEWMPIGELASRAGVSPDALRAWERRYGLLRPRRTAGNRRLYSSADEARVRLMRRYLAEGKPAGVAAEIVSAMRLTVHAGAGARVAPADVAAAHAELRQALDDFAETAAQRVLERLFVAYARVAVIRDVLLPYLRDVGERWAADHVTVAQEHFTSWFLEARFMAMSRGWDRGVGPRALLACPTGERHVLGLVAFGVALHELGWRITYLGADTPLPMVDHAANRIAPELIVLAATVPERLAASDSDLRALAARRPCALAGAGAEPAACAALGARHLAHDPVTAASEIAQL